MNQRRQAILVFRTGFLGDTVCAIPAFRLIRQHFASAHLVFLTEARVEKKFFAGDVIADLKIFDEIATYVPQRRAATLVSLVRELRRIKPEKAILLPHRMESPRKIAVKAMMFRLCGARVISAQGHAGGAADLMEPKRLVAELNACDILGSPAEYGIPVNAVARESVLSKLKAQGIVPGKPLMVFCPGGKAPTQRWSLDNYSQVLTALTYQSGINVVGLGSSAEEQECALFFPDPSVRPPFVASLSIFEMFELFRLAVCYFGNDTGPMHVAAAVGTPVAVVMSSRNPRGHWDPDVTPSLIIEHRTSCGGCRLDTCVREQHRCMTAMTPAIVVQQMVPFLQRLAMRM